VRSEQAHEAEIMVMRPTIETQKKIGLLRVYSRKWRMYGSRTSFARKSHHTSTQNLHSSVMDHVISIPNMCERLAKVVHASKNKNEIMKHKSAKAV
jgi:hypothetical protein